MVVCMSRRICVELYREIVALRPDWHDDDDDEGAIKVVMTGSASDPLDWQPHIRNKTRREALAQPLQGPDGPVPARDRARHVAHRLRRAVPAHDVRRQADARPRPDAGHRPREPRLPDKPGGLVVDYLGLADELKQALATYTESGGTGRDGARPGRGGRA